MALEAVGWRFSGLYTNGNVSSAAGCQDGIILLLLFGVMGTRNPLDKDNGFMDLNRTSSKIVRCGGMVQSFEP